MTEYIEREKTVELLRSLGNRGYRREKGTIQDAIKMISSPEYTPAADVAPVRHGHWIIGIDNDDFDVKCSICEWTDTFEVAGIAAVERIAKAMHYCPNCGAKMDEVIE